MSASFVGVKISNEPVWTVNSVLAKQIILLAKNVMLQLEPRAIFITGNVPLSIEAFCIGFGVKRVKLVATKTKA